MSESGEIHTAGKKKFTLSPAVTAVTNLTSEGFVKLKFGSCKNQMFENDIA